MNGDEYHAIDDDEESSNYGVCRYCGQAHGDHDRACPLGTPDDYDDPERRGREEDRVFQDLRERWTEGP